jgi:hypothetical protein
MPVGSCVLTDHDVDEPPVFVGVRFVIGRPTVRVCVSDEYEMIGADGVCDTTSTLMTKVSDPAEFVAVTV